MAESRFYHISAAGKLTRLASVTEALARVGKDGFIWLDYFQPEKQELEPLMAPLDLHPLAIEDCIDQQQLPKIEDFPHNTFAIFNAFKYADKKLAIDEVDLFIGAHFVISVSGVESEGRRPLAGVEHLVELNLETVRHGPAYLLHLILDHVVDAKFTAVEALEEELDAAEEAMLADPSHFHPAELMRLRRCLLTLRKSLYHEREILVKICRNDCPFIAGKAIYRYRDIYDHLARIFELADTYREIVTSLMELYMSMINNEMTRTANVTNATVRRLTFIATIFMPLTLLASVGGMSEWSMMTGPENWKIAYPAFMAGMVAIGAATYFVLRWMNRRKDQ